jgi:F0F1-type ATP synthase assembly protein I
MDERTPASDPDEEAHKGELPPSEDPAAGAIEFLTLGIAVAVVVVGFGALGYLADGWAGTTPWLTLVGLALGITTAVLLTIARVRKYL